jgi:hypothetical protein
MTKQEKLLNKYYSGETSLEEEKELKSFFDEEESNSAEQDIFGYFERESKVPADLEDNILANLKNTTKKKKSIRVRLYRITSVAAVILILLTVYLDFRDTRNAKLENDFFVMEQALFQISESIQPKEQEEMLVLWVDDDVEIIIN